jgi:hypothetical protein
MYSLSKLETFLPLTSVMSQDLALQESASQVQATSADLWMFSVNSTSPLMSHFRLLTPTEFHHYRTTCIILLPIIKF